MKRKANNHVLKPRGVRTLCKLSYLTSKHLGDLIEPVALLMETMLLRGTSSWHPDCRVLWSRIRNLYMMPQSIANQRGSKNTNRDPQFPTKEMSLVRCSQPLVLPAQRF